MQDKSKEFLMSLWSSTNPNCGIRKSIHAITKQHNTAKAISGIQSKHWLPNSNNSYIEQFIFNLQVI